MKIHIVGGPGSGKTFLAEKLSRELGIPHYDLDDIQWANESGYGKKRDAGDRDALLNEILQKDQWIIEGVYYAWCGRCFEDADRIYLMTVPRRVYRYRILRRFLRRLRFRRFPELRCRWPGYGYQFLSALSRRPQWLRFPPAHLGYPVHRGHRHAESHP